MNDSIWAGEFGDDYTARQADMVSNNEAFFCRALHSVAELDSVIEYGAGAGMNLAALRNLSPAVRLTGIEVNRKAFERMKLYADEAILGSMLDPAIVAQADIAFTKGVLIHIPPEHLETAYRKLYASATKYILIAEYYNPVPVEVPYRGRAGMLWKRDFAGEMMDMLHLRLCDYGFFYHRGPFPQDDVHWFLMERTQ